MRYNNTMLWFLYHILKENKKNKNKIHHVINECCQQIAVCLHVYSCLLQIFCQFAPAVCIPSRLRRHTRKNGNKRHIQFNVIHEVDDYQKGMRNNNRRLPKKAV